MARRANVAQHEPAAYHPTGLLAMTLSDVMVQVVLPSLASLSAGGAAGLVYAKRAHKARHSDPLPPASSLPPLRSEQLPEWARTTWTQDRAEREAAEATLQAAEIDARRDSRERITALERAGSNHAKELGLIGYRLTNIEAVGKEQSAVLGTVRDAVLQMRATCPQCNDSEPAPVVRGGAAGR